MPKRTKEEHLEVPAAKKPRRSRKIVGYFCADCNKPWTTDHEDVCSMKLTSEEKKEEEKIEPKNLIDKNLFKIKKPIYTKFCYSVTMKIPCPHKKCSFAHSEEQLIPIRCDLDNKALGTSCCRVRLHTRESEESGLLPSVTYVNVENEKICNYQHEFESKTNYITRTAYRK